MREVRWSSPRGCLGLGRTLTGCRLFLASIRGSYSGTSTRGCAPSQAGGRRAVVCRARGLHGGTGPLRLFLSAGCAKPAGSPRAFSFSLLGVLRPTRLSSLASAFGSFRRCHLRGSRLATLESTPSSQRDSRRVFPKVRVERLGLAGGFFYDLSAEGIRIAGPLARAVRHHSIVAH